MLVFSRRPTEEFMMHVGDETIVVRFIKMKGPCVQFGVTASQNVRIIRTELAELSTELKPDAVLVAAGVAAVPLVTPNAVRVWERPEEKLKSKKA